MATKPLSEIVNVKESLEEKLLKQPGVTGVDVGYKYVDGKPTDEIAIRVMVEKKKKTVPAKEKVPETIDGVKTDVIERTYFLQEAKNRKPVEEVEIQSDTGTYNPVKGGISIGPCRVVGGSVYAGTLGAIVKDNATSNPMLLSNFHVMCVDTGWHVGDTMAQPSRVDGGSCPASVVGTLQRAQLTGSVDAAVSSLSGRSYSCEIVDIGMVAGTNTATLGMAVRKRGRTTGLTYGIVDSISLTINVNYGDGIGAKTLTNQIGIRPDTAHNPAFGDHGDSGSVVVDNARKIVGLHFAGSSDGHGVANQIAAVLSALNVSVCTGVVKSAIKDLIDAKHGHKDFKEIEKIRKEKNEKFEIKELEKIVFEGKGPVEKFTEGGKLAEVGLPGSPALPAAAQIDWKALSDKPHAQDKFLTFEGGTQASDASLQKGGGVKLEATEGGGGGGGGGKGKDKDKDIKDVDIPPPKDWQKDFKELKDSIKEKDKDKDKDKDQKDKDKDQKDKDFGKDVHPDKTAHKEIKDFQDGSDGNLMAASIAASGAAASKNFDKPFDKPFEKTSLDKHPKELKVELKDGKNEAKEFKIEAKEHKNEFKDHKNERKEFIKDKVELKEQIKTEFEKPIRDNVKDFSSEGGPKLSDVGDPFGPGLLNPGVQGASAQAGGASPTAKMFDKSPEKLPPDKPVKSDKEKVEIKEQKNEAKEVKIEFKEHKNEIKEHKNELKEGIKDKDKIETKEHKPEAKELKIEAKEHIKPELEKSFLENPKQLVEGGGGKLFEGGGPFQPNLPVGGGVQGASADPQASAFKIKENIKSEIEKIKREKEIEKIKPEKEFKEGKEKEFKEGKEKDFKEGKEKDFKDGKEIEKIKAEKEFSKDFHIDKHKVEFEKIFPENPKSLVEGGHKFFEGGDPFRPNLPAAGGVQGASADPQAAKTKDFEKVSISDKGKIEIEKFKREKEFEKIKPEKEHKEKELEKIQHEKFKFEKEFQFDKHKVEFEKLAPENPKLQVEGGPGFPNLPGGPIESRMSQLEAAVAQLSTFITQGMRPDLGAGALTNEPDQKPKDPGSGGG